MQEIQETRVRILGQEDSLQERMATHASNRAWKMPWIKEPGRVQSMESQRVNVTEVTEHISAMYWLSVFQPRHGDFLPSWDPLCPGILLLQVWSSAQWHDIAGELGGNAGAWAPPSLLQNAVCRLTLSWWDEGVRVHLQLSLGSLSLATSVTSQLRANPCSFADVLP